MKEKIKKIAMLSTHGYFDPTPKLGKIDTGGQVVYVLELSKYISKNHNVKIDIFTRWFDESKKQIDPVPAFQNVRIIRIPAGPWKFIPKEEIYKALSTLSQNMINFINRNNLKYDLFHSHYVDAGIVAIDVAKNFKKPAFFTPHSLGAWKRKAMKGNPEKMEKEFKFKRRIKEELRILKSIKAVTLTTNLQKEKLKNLYGFYSKNIEIIPPGVDIKKFCPTSKDKDKNKNFPKKYIFCLSRIDSNKGHYVLLDAFSALRKKIPGVKLIIGGGSPNPQKTELEILAKMKKIINKEKMREDVIMTGYISDEELPSFYRRASVFVLPSIFEPFGMTALEAMACEKPIVASKFGGIKDVISEKHGGSLIDPNNPKEFSEAIKKFLENPDLAKKTGKEGRKNVCENFSWDSIAKRYIKFYESYIN